MRLYDDAKWLTSSTVFLGVLTALRSVFTLAIVGPAVIGVWKACMALYPLGEISRLGVSKGMSILVPMLNGQGKDSDSEHTAQTAGDFSVIAGAVMGVGVFSWSFFVNDAEYRMALRFMAIVLLLAQPHQFLRDFAVATRRFPIRAKENIFSAFSEFFFFIALASWFGLAGLGMAACLSIGLPALYLVWKLRFKFKLHKPTKSVFPLMKRGLPLSGAETLYELTRRMDLIFLTILMGPTWVGYYGISLLVMDFAVFLARYGVSQVVSPNLLHEFGRAGSLEKVATYYEIPARVGCYVLPPLLSVGALTLPIFVKVALPQFVPGIEAAQIMIWGLVFVSIHASLISFLVAAGKLFSEIKMLGAVLPVSALLQLGSFRLGFGLEGAAGAALVTLAIISVGEITLARRCEDHSTSEIVGFIATLYLPTALCLPLTLLVQAWDVSEIVPLLFALPFKALVIVISYTPIFLAYESRFSLIRSIRHGAAA